MIANETTLQKRINEAEINSYRSSNSLQQRAEFIIDAYIGSIMLITLELQDTR